MSTGAMESTSQSDQHRRAGSWRGKSLLTLFKKSKKQTLKKEVQQVKSDQLYMENSFHSFQSELDKLIEDNRLLNQSCQKLKRKLDKLEAFLRELAPQYFTTNIPGSQAEDSTDTCLLPDDEDGILLGDYLDIDSICLEHKQLESSPKRHQYSCRCSIKDDARYASTRSKYELRKTRPLPLDEPNATSSETQLHSTSTTERSTGNTHSDLEGIRQHNLSAVLSGGNTSDFINIY